MNEITVPDTAQVDNKAMSSVAAAQAMTIKTDKDFTVADFFCVNLKALEKEIIDTFKEPKEKAWSAHKAIVAAEAKHLLPVQEARKIAKEKMSEFQDEQECIRQAEEKRLQEEANKRAEEDAIQAAAEAEKSGDRDR
jgi:hypothetical protein